MQVLFNFQGQTYCVQLQEGMTAAQVVAQIKEEFGFELDLALFSGCERLDSSFQLTQESSMMNFSVLAEVVGGKKKKKKVFTTPKRKKHIHKNVKLRALSYFSVNKDGTVSKVKKLCEMKECKGQGIFMASHKNRFYCGKCHTTMVKKEETKAQGKK